MKMYTFALTEQEANTVLNALSHLPYRDAAPLIANLQHQAGQQNQTTVDTTEQQEEVK